MTIGIGFKCFDGIVIATDSQVTVGDSIKSYAPKVIPIERPNLTILIAGAGNRDLMHSAVEDLKESIKPELNHSIPELRINIEQYLVDFYKEYVYPIPDYQQHGFDLLIGIQTNENFELFKTTDGRVYRAFSGRPFGYCTIGSAQSLANYVVSRFFRGSTMSVTEAKFIATLCIDAAKKHDPYCGGDTQLWTLTDVAPFRANQVYMSEIADTEELSNSLFDRLQMLIFPLIDPTIGSNIFKPSDTSIDPDHLDELTSSFKDLMLDYRQKQKNRRQEQQAREKQRSKQK